MGCFSWMYCDKGNSEPLNIDNAGYLLNPFGENYFENAYDGYGRFDNHDVYDLVADWNKDFIPIMLAYADKGMWECDLSTIDRENLIAFSKGESISCEKRLIGIMMACYDEDNARLFYPIKIAKKDINYYKACPSESDPNQGFGENEDEWY